MMMLPQQEIEMEEDSPDDLDDFDPESGVGVITIEGALTYKPVEGMCGEVGCSYESLLDNVSDMIEEGAKIIIFNIDSGGGEGYGAFETANEIRKKCDEAGVYTIAYNDGCMCSAAYALACVCDEVIANPDAETGSIGVLVALINDSEHLAKEGYARSFITAGDSKVPFDEEGGWRPEFLTDLQTKVDTLYQKFVAHVATYTGLSSEQIIKTQAKTYMADDALSLGLINSIKTRSEFIDYILQKQGAMNA